MFSPYDVDRLSKHQHCIKGEIRTMKRVPDKKKCYSSLLFILVLAVLFFHNTGGAAFAEDLVLSGDQVMVIENTTYVQTGNIYINDNAKLTIRNAILVLNINYHEEFMVYLQGSGTIEVINSTVKTNLISGLYGNEIVVINFGNSSNLIFQDSNLSDGLVFLQYSANYQGNTSISNSFLQALSLTLTPSGAGAVSVANSSCNSMMLRFESNYQGEFSDLRPGLLSSWSYTQNGYNIALHNTSINNYVLACDGPCGIVVRNSEIHQFTPNSPQSVISMTAIDSTLIQIPLHGLSNITASFWGLKTGLFADWALSDHCSGEYLPNVILKNTTIQEGWFINGFGNSNISVDDSTLSRLGFYSNNTEITITNSTVVDELMFYGATAGTLTSDNTLVSGLVTFYVPPNSVEIKGNLAFTQGTKLEWVSPSEATRTYEVVVKDADQPVQGASLSLYATGDTLVWSGTTDAEGKASFTLHFTDSNYSNSWRLETKYLGAIKGRKEIGLITSTPVEIVLYNVTPSVTEGTIGTEITFTDPPSGFGTDKGKVLIGGMAQKVESWSNTSVKVIVKKPPPQGVTAYDVSIQPKPKGTLPIDLPGGFTVQNPTIDPLLDSLGSSGKKITISGKFFSSKKGKVFLEDPVSGKKKNCKVISWSMDPTNGESTLTFVVPKLPKGVNPGTYPLKVTNKVGSAQTTFTVEP